MFRLRLAPALLTTIVIGCSDSNPTPTVPASPSRNSALALNADVAGANDSLTVSMYSTRYLTSVTQSGQVTAPFGPGCTRVVTERTRRCFAAGSAAGIRGSVVMSSTVMAGMCAAPPDGVQEG